MTKQELLGLLDCYEEDGEVNINELLRDLEEERQRRIEDLEERQHQSGFYAFQDALYTWRSER